MAPLLTFLAMFCLLVDAGAELSASPLQGVTLHYQVESSGQHFNLWLPLNVCQEAPAEVNIGHSGPGTGHLLFTEDSNSMSYELWSQCGQNCVDCPNGTGESIMLPSGLIKERLNNASRDIQFLMCVGKASELVDLASVGGCIDSQVGEANEGRELDPWVEISLAVAYFASILMLLLCAAYKIYKTVREPQAVRPKPLQEDSLKKRFPSGEALARDTCVVCLGDVEEGERCRELQCGHVFHADCILEWWLHVPRVVVNCPICRHRQRVRTQSFESLEEHPLPRLMGHRQANVFEPECSPVAEVQTPARSPSPDINLDCSPVALDPDADADPDCPRVIEGLTPDLSSAAEDILRVPSRPSQTVPHQG